jgi:glycosyltransferase involved in cell wall biosynthesis
LLIARFEPENNIEIILKTYKDFEKNTLVLVGNHQSTAFGGQMFKVYSTYKNIVFAGGIYNIHALNALRLNSRLYFHGHSVGGTNPSLLEAMACNTLICAHDNIFNRHVLNNDAFYFKTKNDIENILNRQPSKADYKTWLQHNLDKLKNEYNWQIITSKLEEYFTKWINEKRN